jgi:hypothetical protein
MNKPFALLVVALLAANSAQADQDDFRCFKSVGGKNALKLQFVFQANGLGYVIYQGGSARIPVKMTKEKEVRGKAGSPSEFKTEWQETTPDGSGGTYAYTNEGSSVENFRYFRKDGKVFKFEEDTSAMADNGCAWARK